MNLFLPLTTKIDGKNRHAPAPGDHMIAWPELTCIKDGLFSILTRKDLSYKISICKSTGNFIKLNQTLRSFPGIAMSGTEPIEDRFKTVFQVKNRFIHFTEIC